MCISLQDIYKSLTFAVNKPYPNKNCMLKIIDRETLCPRMVELSGVDESTKKKELEDIFADRGMPVRMDKKYMEESKFHLSADLLCDRNTSLQNTLEPKEKLLKDMEITTAKGIARGE